MLRKRTSRGIEGIRVKAERAREVGEESTGDASVGDKTGESVEVDVSAATIARDVERNRGEGIGLAEGEGDHRGRAEGEDSIGVRNGGVSREGVLAHGERRDSKDGKESHEQRGLHHVTSRRVRRGMIFAREAANGLVARFRL